MSQVLKISNWLKLQKGVKCLQMKVSCKQHLCVAPRACQSESLLMASAKLWHRERGILLSRQGLIKSPFEVNRKIPIDLNRLWSKSLIMRACNNLLIASLCTMVTLDLWPLWRLDSLSYKISTSQSDPLARASPQVLFLSSFSCLKGLSLGCSSAPLLWVCQQAHILHSPLSYCSEDGRDRAVHYTSNLVHKPGKVLGTSSRLSMAMQKPCVPGSHLCQCASNSKNSLVSVRLFNGTGG